MLWDKPQKECVRHTIKLTVKLYRKTFLQYPNKMVTDGGILALPSCRTEIKRGGQADSEGKGFTKNKVRGKRERRSLMHGGTHSDRVWPLAVLLGSGLYSIGFLCTGAEWISCSSGSLHGLELPGTTVLVL